MNDSLIDHKKNVSPIVALHSFATGKQQWDKLKFDLNNQSQVLAIDLPGCHSNSGSVEKSGDCSAFTIDRIYDKLVGNSDKVHLVGHSSGGSVALKLALQHPEMFKSITIYEPTVFHLTDSTNRIGNKLQHEFGFMKEALLNSGNSDVSVTGIEEFWSFWNDTELWEQLSIDGQKKFSSNIKNVVSDIEACFSGNWSLGDLTNLNIPVLIIMGMQSPIVIQNLAVQIVSALPAGRLSTLPMYGHFAPITHPEVINPLIIEHILDVEQRLQGKGTNDDQPVGDEESDSRKNTGFFKRIRNSNFSLFS